MRLITTIFLSLLTSGARCAPQRGYNDSHRGYASESDLGARRALPFDLSYTNYTSYARTSESHGQKHDQISQDGATERLPDHLTTMKTSTRTSNAGFNESKREAVSPTSSDAPEVTPTPAPTGSSSPSTTVHITDNGNFALLLPKKAGELISEAESDGVSFCTLSSSGCANTLPAGFITAAAYASGGKGKVSWMQVTGCIDTSKYPLSPTDDGGQFDVRFPNGAQCTFGGYGASFIEQVEPSAKRFCLRCCAAANDQVHCNSHRDRAGCPVAVPGTYDFPALGVSCA